MTRDVKLQIYVSSEVAQEFLAECERQSRSISWLGERAIKQFLNTSEVSPINSSQPPAPSLLSHNEQISEICTLYKTLFPRDGSISPKLAQDLLHYGFDVALAALEDVAARRDAGQTVTRPFGLAKHLLSKGEIIVHPQQQEAEKPQLSEDILADYRRMRERPPEELDALFNKELAEILNE